MHLFSRSPQQKNSARLLNVRLSQPTSPTVTTTLADASPNFADSTTKKSQPTFSRLPRGRRELSAGFVPGEKSKDIKTTEVRIISCISNYFSFRKTSRCSPNISCRINSYTAGDIWRIIESSFTFAGNWSWFSKYFRWSNWSWRQRWKPCRRRYNKTAG